MHTEDHSTCAGDRLLKARFVLLERRGKKTHQLPSSPWVLIETTGRASGEPRRRLAQSLYKPGCGGKNCRLGAGSSPSATGSHQKSAKAPGTRVQCEVERGFSAYTVVGLQPITIPAGHAVFAILAPVTGETDAIEFTWGSVGDIWYRAPRDLFLKSTRH
jgi:hypothetical protein